MRGLSAAWSALPFLLAWPAGALEPHAAGAAASTAPVALGAAPSAVGSSSAAAPGAGAGEWTDADRRRGLLLTDLLIAEDRLGEAWAFARARLDDDGRKPVWLMRLARVAALQGRSSEAAAFYKELLALQGESVELLMQLGSHAQDAGERAVARGAFERARTLDPGPLPRYRLSELSFSEGEEKQGKKYAMEALAAMPEPAPQAMRRMRLRLRSRAGWEDSIDREFQELFESEPGEAESLFEWTGALFRAGLERDADEPLALLRERFPDQAFRTRRLELERLRQMGAWVPYDALVEDSVLRWPGEPAFRFSRGERLLRSRRWIQAGRDLSFALSSPAYRKLAGQSLLELHREYDHHVGPYVVLHQTEGSRYHEEGVAYRGHLREALRAEAKAGVTTYKVPPRTFSLTSLHGTAAWESGPWTAGGDAEVTGGAGSGGFSPGVFGRWEPKSGWGVGADGALRRAWASAAGAVDAGATTDRLGVNWDTLPRARIYFGGQASYNLHHVDGGGRAERTVLSPQLVYRVMDRPFYLGAGYRFLAQDAWGQEAFFDKLSLTRRTRTHYATLSLGKRWLGGRLAANGHAFNGHDDGRGRKFTSFDLAGMGAGLDWFGERLHVKGGYDFSRDSESGIGGGMSHTLRLAVEWHWYGHGDKNTPR
ncbi:MAG: hypothetical protein HY927_02215 [Elusimicrobia bacterium]|nr:hypothetical protein [Elusimicrobiota bacterium]